MRLLGSPSIKLKLTLIAALTSTLALLVAAVGFIYYDQTTFKAKMKTDLATEARVIGGNCGAPLVFGDTKALNETLSALAAQHDIRSAAVYTPDGKLVATYCRPGTVSPPASVSRTTDRAYFQADGLKVFRTVFSDQDAVGTLFIESDLSEWEARRNRHLGILVPLVGSCILISIFFGSRLQRIISKPLLDLVDTTRLVSSEKRYDIRANKIADDEVGQLVDGFNSMLAEIEARDQELHDINDELEERVKYRTTQLEEEIVERKLAQEEVTKSQEILDDFFENAAIGLHFLDPEGVIIRANHAELEMLGYKAEEYIGKPASAFHEDPSVMVDLMERLRRGESVIAIESRMISSDGSIKHVALDANARWEGDTFVHARCFTRDQTAQKEAERAREATERAERANQAKSEFLSRMSHELRTPMNSILGFSQLLELEDLTEDQRDSARQIIIAGKHLLRLINEVLDISRIESGNLSLSIEPVEAFEAIREVVDIIQPLAKDRSISIQVRESNQPVFVQADAQRLRQVLLNLVSNAIKYNIQAGIVKISVDQHGDLLRFNVVDSGPGITQAQAEQLFIPFQRLGAESSGVEGTGLGLALSLRLAEAMGGTIGLEPSDSGAHFYLQLARVESPISLFLESGDEPELAPGIGDTSPKLSVLLVEDNSANVRLVEKCLSHFEHVTLRVATTGQAGIDSAMAEPPNLVLLDINLPDINGLDVLRALKSNIATADIPIVVTSADASPRQIGRLIEAGAAEYLTKPMDIHALWKTFERFKQGGLEKSA